MHLYRLATRFIIALEAKNYVYLSIDGYENIYACFKM